MRGPPSGKIPHGSIFVFEGLPKAFKNMAKICLCLCLGMIFLDPFPYKIGVYWRWYSYHCWYISLLCIFFRPHFRYKYFVIIFFLEKSPIQPIRNSEIVRGTIYWIEDPSFIGVCSLLPLFLHKFSSNLKAEMSIRRNLARKLIKDSFARQAAYLPHITVNVGSNW